MMPTLLTKTKHHYLSPPHHHLLTLLLQNFNILPLRFSVPLCLGGVLARTAGRSSLAGPRTTLLLPGTDQAGELLTNQLRVSGE